MSQDKQRPKLFNQEYQKEWSETHKYKHIHTGEYCTFEAYVAEYLIIRKAEAFKEPKPSYKFWTKGDKLYPSFVRQLKAVITLRKKYSEKTILGAINSVHFAKVFYVGLYEKNYVGWKMNPLASEAIEKYHMEEQEHERLESIKKENETINIVEEVKEIRQRRTQQITNKQSVINRLRNI
jgi:hypothetical protein